MKGFLGLDTVSTRTVLENEIDVSVSLSGVDEVDDVSVQSQVAVQCELLGFVVDSEVKSASCAAVFLVRY